MPATHRGTDMRFTKMQAAGNDYVYVDCFNQRVDDPAALARAVSDRHFGIGADGLILVTVSSSADVGMRMFNSDGSEGGMCGNGVRCLAKYAYEHGLCRGTSVRVATAAGPRTVELALDTAGKVASATVDMGEPVFDAAAIGLNTPDEKLVDYPLATSAGRVKITCVSMGNPHVVIYEEPAGACDLERLGPELQAHELFPDGVNVHVVNVRASDAADVRTWERGSGPTLACGTGAAAVCAAGALLGRTDRRLAVRMPGGTIDVDWRQQDNHIYIAGPVVEVFTGDWPERAAAPAGE
jgi:diaminopimelate epimerase